jgi:hypothetical protein
MALSSCQAAALEIDSLLRRYRSEYCINSPPYFISYATYVSATIHVRTASVQPHNKASIAHWCLRNCLEVLAGHQEVCHAPRRSMVILLGLIERHNIDVGKDFTALISRTGPCGAQQQLRTIDGSELGFGVIPPEDMETETSEGHMASLSNAASDALSPGAPANVDPALADYGWDELLAHASFDLDPLFGFDMQTPPEPGLHF